jgi:hypothetical protein
MVPANQSFEHHDFVAGDVANRLIVDLEFVALQRHPQVEFQQPPGLGAGIHPGFEEAVGAAAVRLGSIERQIGILQELIGILSVLGRQRNADADPDNELVAADIVGRGDLLDDEAGKGCDCRRVAVAAKLHDREFVSAESRDGIVLADAFAEPVGDLLQQGVADRVTERVIDVLEVIEIEAKYRELTAALGKPQRLLELLSEQRPVGQIGQRVVARHVRDLFLGLLPLGDVLEGRNPAATLHRLIDHADRTALPGDDLGHGIAGPRRRYHFGEELIGITAPDRAAPSSRRSAR